MNLANIDLGTTVTVQSIGGHGSFRRRLLELGLLPGTSVTLQSVAPLGDPLELLVRGASMSIRRADAAVVEVVPRQNHSHLSSAQPHSGMPLGTDNWAGSTP